VLTHDGKEAALVALLHITDFLLHEQLHEGLAERLVGDGDSIVASVVAPVVLALA
jgi:hypothetical protein